MSISSCCTPQGSHLELVKVVAEAMSIPVFARCKIAFESSLRLEKFYTMNFTHTETCQTVNLRFS